MNTKPHHWIFSVVLALATHSAVLLTLFLTYESHGAKAEGENGIDINLGMLGDAGEAAASSATNKPPSSVAPAKPPLEANTEMPKPKAPANTVVDIVSEARKPEKAQPRQTPALMLKKAEEPLVKEKNAVATAIDEREPQKTITGDFDVTPKPNEATLEENLIAELIADLETKNEMSQLSKTTGVGSDSNAGGQAGHHQDYLAKLVAQLTEHKHYPRLSRKRSEEGVAVLSFDISRTGRVLHYQIKQSTGFIALDNAVLAMLKNAQPFAPVPSEIKGEQISFTLPIAFKMKNS